MESKILYSYWGLWIFNSYYKENEDEEFDPCISSVKILKSVS